MTAPVDAGQRSVLRVVLGAPRSVWILVGGVFVNRLGSFFSTFATLFLADRGFTGSSLPLALVGVGAAGMIGSLAGGWLADRVGHRASLVTSMFTTAGALALLAIAPTKPLVAAAVCLVGFCSQSYTPAASALLVANSSPRDRVPIFAFFRLALNLGAALGPLIAGLLATDSFTLMFLVGAGTSVLCGLVILVGLPRVGAADATAEPAEEPSAAGGEPAPVPARWRDGHLVPVVLCVLLVGVAMIYAQHASSLALQLTANGFDTRFYGMLLALNGFLVIVGELPISSVTRRMPWRIPLIAGVALMAAGLVVAGLTTGPVLIVAGFVVFTIGEMAFAPVANAAVAELSPTGTTARYQGLLASAQSLGFSLGPAVGTAVFAVSQSGLWVGTAVFAAVLCLGIAILRKVRP